MYEGFYEFYSVTKAPTIDFDTGVQIWSIYLKDRMSYHKEFMEFLEGLEKKPVKVHRDLWKMIYEFADTVNRISDYKEEDGWPVLLDDFVAYLKDKGVK